MLSFRLYDLRKNKYKNTLQVHPFYIKNCISARKASFFASFSKKIAAEAFFTVEATLVLPVVIFFIGAFMWFFMVFKIQIELQSSLRNISYELSEYAFLYERVKNLSESETEYIAKEDLGIGRWLIGGITEAYVENEIKKYIGEESNIWNYIEGGKDGIEIKSFLRIPNKDGMIDLVLIYEIRNPFIPGDFGKSEYIQRSRIRAWTGYGYISSGEEENEDTLVYITEYGKVYHLTKECTHLDLSIISLPYEGSMMWYNRKLYSQCMICPHVYTDTVYLTETGDRFHVELSCRGLKRTIYEVPIESVVGYAPCSRCGKEIEE